MLTNREILKRVVLKLSKVFQIKWTRPKFRKEFDEYFGNGETRDAFREHGLTFEQDKDLVIFLSNGVLRRLSDEDLKEAKNMTTNVSEFNEEMKDQVYSQSFKKMEKDLMGKDLTLEAPIVIKFSDGTYWGFSGNRRANLARKHDLPVLYFLVDQKKYDQNEKKLKALE